MWSGPGCSSTKLVVALSDVVWSAACFRNSVRTTEPPSVSKVTRITSLLTVTSSRGAAEGVADAPGGAATVPPGWGTPAVLGAGTLAAPAGAAAVAVGLGAEGKKVAC